MKYSDGMTLEQVNSLPDNVKCQVVQQRIIEAINTIANECNMTWQYYIESVSIVVAPKQDIVQ